MSDSEKDNKDESIKDTPDSRTEDKSETLPETGDIQKDGSGSDERPAAQSDAGGTAQDTDERQDSAQESQPDHPLIAPVTVIENRPMLPFQIQPVQLSAEAWGGSVQLLASGNEKYLATFFPKKGVKSDAPIGERVSRTGCLVKIIHARANNESINLIVEGICRVRIRSWLKNENSRIPYAELEYITDEEFYDAESLDRSVTDHLEFSDMIKALSNTVIEYIKNLLVLNPMYGEQLKLYQNRLDPKDPSPLADCAAAISTADSTVIQDILDTVPITARLRKIVHLLGKELEIAKLQNQIQGEVSGEMQKQQRNYWLREQVKVIQKELGDSVSDKVSDVNEFKKREAELALPAPVKEKYESEIKKLNILETGSPEYGVTRNYLDWLLSVPWGKYSKDNFDLGKARKILEEDHDSLEDVKQRIVEFLGVGAYRKDISGAIILLVGPPGVGKTSVGRSIARAMNRPFFRFSVGGMRDETEIKGHRRTYVGALPGRIVLALKDTKVMNPVIMLDEIDKVGESAFGDPAATLLETLDPEQNRDFLDNYLDVRLDLSKCLFICTANTTDSIPSPLLDRMEVIRLPGYLTEEKIRIARNHLLPKIMEKCGLKPEQLKISDQVIRKIIEGYAREAGVRHLEKLLERIARKVIIDFIDNKKDSAVIKAGDLESYLKTPVFRKDDSMKGVGIMTGLAWTSMGGATLPIESAVVSREQSGLVLTGNLGKVMQESATIALSFISANIGKYAPDSAKFFEKAKVHIHVPEGATPKDGPSAGSTIATSLLSLALSKAPKDGFAMTGEISLTGHVLAIGGLREKTLAAKRLGIKDLIVPDDNRPSVKEIPDYVKKGIRYHYVKTFDDVVKILF